MQAYIEKEDSKKLKQKQRERMQPKMGKMDIDYQVTSIVYCFLCASFFFFFYFLFLKFEESFSTILINMFILFSILVAMLIVPQISNK